MGKATCLWCDGNLVEILDLGAQPLANSLLKSQYETEMTYPLIFCQCENCKLSQVMRFNYQPFGDDYPYYSSVNAPYVRQCKELAESLIKEFNPKSVIEVGCNDGYMLENFKHIEHAGYEPSAGPANVARSKGLTVFNVNFYSASQKVDMILAFNVVPHTPNLRQMIQDIKKSLNPNGVVVIEVQDLTNLLKRGYFDCIYHEHYSYFEHNTLMSCFEEEGLVLFEAEEIPSHGGSLRYYFRHSIKNEFFKEKEYADFSALKEKSRITKGRIRNLIDSWNVVMYGAPAKGNTLLNYCGVKADDVCYTIDETEQKQNKFLPGSHIPIRAPHDLFGIESPKMLILPWNFEAEIRSKICKLNYSGEIITPWHI